MSAISTLIFIGVYMGNPMPVSVPSAEIRDLGPLPPSELKLPWFVDQDVLKNIHKKTPQRRKAKIKKC